MYDTLVKTKENIMRRINKKKLMCVLGFIFFEVALWYTIIGIEHIVCGVYITELDPPFVKAMYYNVVLGWWLMINMTPFVLWMVGHILKSFWGWLTK